MTTGAFLGATTLFMETGHGGLGRVARLMARVLAEEVQAGRLRAAGACYFDDRVWDDRLPARPVRESKLRFLWEVQRGAVSFRHFLYDYLGMARAHCRFPLLRRPYLAWIHGVEVWEGAAPYHLRCARRADVLVSNTAYTCERADRLHGGFQRARVCWLGTETDDLPTVPRPGECRPTVLILARMEEPGYKGHRELIDAWPKVVAAVADAQLVIVGCGSLQAELQRRAAASTAADHIVFKGFVPDQDVPKIWGECSVFAMPSRGEGLGLVYLEAMRHARPVVASIHDAAPEINLDGITGYNVDLDKPDELPERLIHLLKNPDHAAALGSAAQERWRETFTYSAFKARFLSLLTPFLNS